MRNSTLNNDEADIVLKNYENYNYVGTFFVGTPPQEMRVIFDTGSANIWLLSSLCPNQDIYALTNEVYDPDLSTSFNPTELIARVTFGTGEIYGMQAFDDVLIGTGQANHELIHVRN